MTNWLLLLPCLAFFLTSIAFALLMWLERFKLLASREMLFFARLATDKMAQERDEVQNLYNQLAEANGLLYAQKEDLREALEDAMNEVKALQLATMPMEAETPTVAPIAAKRGSRSKKAASE